MDFSVTRDIPTGGTVEVCYRNTCRAGEGVNLPPTTEGEPRSGYVPVAGLGDWRDHTDRPLTIRVLDAAGEVTWQTDALAERRNSCCGDDWSVDQP